MRKTHTIVEIKNDFNIAVGDIFAGALEGPDSYRFFQVVGLSSKSVKVRSLKRKFVSGRVDEEVRCVPIKDDFKDEKPVTMRTYYRNDNRGVFIKADICNCRVWDGTREFKVTK